MIHLPAGIDNAVWLLKQQNNPQLGPWQKNYILASGNKYLFRVFNKPDGVFMGNIVESYNPAKDAASKLKEKEEKGYKVIATWDESSGLWAQPSSMPLLRVAGRPPRHLEHQLERLVLKEKRGTGRKITLELFRTADNLYRIDHKESWQEPDHDGSPLWQTLFPNEAHARKVMQEVVEKKELEGYSVIKQPPVRVQQQTNSLADLYPLSTKVAEALKGVQADAWF